MPQKKRKRLSFKDILIAYRHPTKGGLRAVEELVANSRGLSRDVVRSLIKEMEANPVAREQDLLDYAREMFKPRGRPAPAIGEERPYVVSARQSYSVPTLRVPLFHFTVTPGDVIGARFFKNRLVVEFRAKGKAKKKAAR